MSNNVTLLTGLYGLGNIGDELMCSKLCRVLPRPLLVARYGKYQNLEIPCDVETCGLYVDEVAEHVASRRISHLVIGGGTCFTSGFMRAFSLIKYAKENFCAKVSIWGVSISPHDPDTVECSTIRKVVMHSDEVKCRDMWSYEYLKRICPDKVSMCEDIMCETWVRKKPATICLAEWSMNNYSRETVQSVANMCREAGRELRIIPFFPTETNVGIAIDGLDLSGVTYSVIGNCEYPSVYASAVRDSCAMLSFKYHPSLLAMQCGVPTISSYSKNDNKFKSIHDGRYGACDLGCVHVSELNSELVEGKLRDAIRSNS